jgi:hypothetical protein
MDLIRISAAMVLSRYLTVKLLELLTLPAETTANARRLSLELGLG